MMAALLDRFRLARKRFGVRLVAGTLVVLLPIIVILAVLLTVETSRSLTSAGESKGASVARAIALRIEDWQTGRSQDIALVAARVSGQLSDPANVGVVTQAQKAYAGQYQVVEVTDLTGKVMASSSPGGIDPAGQAWFATAVS